LPVTEKNLGPYHDLATRFGKICHEHGALAYREFRGEDLATQDAIAFTDIVKLKSGDVLTAGVVEFESRAHRDEVMKNVMDDPRVGEMMKEEELADMKRMSYGGFEMFVEA